MDAIDALARVLRVPLLALKRVGYAPAARLSDQEIAGNAHALGAGLLGALWQSRRGAPTWEELSLAWERAAEAREGVDPALHGSFDPADRIDLVTDNAEAFELRSRLVAGAKRGVDVSTYYLQDDETGRRFARDLMAAAERGVRVRLVADEYILRRKDHERPGVMALCDALSAAGVEVRLFRDRERPYDANHRKIMVVDGEALLIGGRNVADHYAGEAWRDVELLVQGPSARAGEALFERTWGREPEPRRGAPGALLHATTPADIGAHATFVYLLQCIRAARWSIDIENAYCFAHDALVRQLAAARRRGVRVRLMTNSAASNDLDYANWRLYSGFLPLLDAGVELWARRGAGRTLHSKYFVVDGEWVSVGSTNLDYYSPRFCTEANLHVRSVDLGARLLAWFDEGLAESERVDDPARVEAVMRGSTLSRGLDRVIRDAQ
jgi:cardiolipin synthase A/B